MNKREAKREACHIVARLLDNYTETDSEVRYSNVSEEDAERIRAAVAVLTDEMNRRAGD